MKHLDYGKYVLMLLKKTPFSNVDVPKFKGDFSQLLDKISALQDRSPIEYPIIVELHILVAEFSPYLESIEMLSNGRMLPFHWKLLFEKCEKPNAYHGQIKIDELIQFGILKNIDKIKEVTAISIGENQLEADFQTMNNQWKEVLLPVDDAVIIQEDLLLLGSLEIFISKYL